MLPTWWPVQMVNVRLPRKRRFEQVLRNQPALSAFTSEINAISATIIGQLDTNFKIGRRAALREIRGCETRYA